MALPVTLEGTRNPVIMWAEEADVEAAALQQLRNIASMPWVHGVRVMPDVHLGKGATVGSVIAMRQAVSPAAVGVDIGCGVAAVRTSLKVDDLERLDALRARIEAAIPVGFSSHDEPVFGLRGKSLLAGFGMLDSRVHNLRDRAAKQLGTLGGGNHFIEVCADESDRVWLTLHSGSRNIGKSLAEIHIETAKSLKHNDGLVDRDLAVFLAGTPEADAYLRDLSWAQAYAAESRRIMMQLLQREFARHFNQLYIDFDNPINAHHNYVSEEVIEGEPMLVTRKGAIRAGGGDMALIPGSMGTGSYVVRGLGNPDSFLSASHGAGRKMSRTRAKKNFTVEDLIAQTEGIECRKDEAIVDEIPGAYKDLHGVIAAQADLVQPVAHLRTLLCVKG